GPDPKPWWVDYRHLVFAVDEGTGQRELLGVGRCGKVYLATYFGTKVAVKEPHNNDDLSPEAIEEFEREIDESYCMRHRNLVPILGGGDGTGQRPPAAGAHAASSSWSTYPTAPSPSCSSRKAPRGCPRPKRRRSRSASAPPSSTCTGTPRRWCTRRSGRRTSCWARATS
ncbi:unnamed protein product, partial [Heterosigma akashiwo]